MKKYIIPVVCLLIGIGCAIAFNVIGSEVMPDGRLVEPFGLIPIGYLFLFLSIVSAVVIFVCAKIKKD